MLFRATPRRLTRPEVPLFGGQLRSRDAAEQRHEMPDGSSLSVAVPWYDFKVHPAQRFTIWAFRHLRLIPKEWRCYYRNILRAELYASRTINTNWDTVMALVDGYRKVKWVLKKFDCKFDESSIPHPYNNFWEVTTHEERSWAFRRSTLLKDLQAIQRDDDDNIQGGLPMQYEKTNALTQYTTPTYKQARSGCHSTDLKAPRESDLATDFFADTMIITVHDDEKWNPARKSKVYEASKWKDETDLMGFEDMDEDDDDDDDDFAPKKQSSKD